MISNMTKKMIDKGKYTDLGTPTESADLNDDNGFECIADIRYESDLVDVDYFERTFYQVKLMECSNNDN